MKVTYFAGFFRVQLPMLWSPPSTRRFIVLLEENCSPPTLCLEGGDCLRSVQTASKMAECFRPLGESTSPARSSKETKQQGTGWGGCICAVIDN